MQQKKLTGLIGSTFLCVGVFAPIATIPMVDNINYVRNGSGDGVIVLILAIIALILVLIDKYKGLWFTSFGSVVVMLFSFLNFQTKISQAKQQMSYELSGNPFRGLDDMAMQSVQLEWGWSLLIIGVSLMFMSATITEKASVDVLNGN
ncbi:hypothetical protein Thiowin_02655 [Thiorhodovibrio winogradskyi]|uniref:Uncharacterized protein n=1 Tax=Thiorhodovibrio winogradskyi TaxID=77007 RepID=A0ABZ0SAF2_9GAMM|nr:hypothetical protein [Thiorhodovibrio winogradskyi]